MLSTAGRFSSTSARQTLVLPLTTAVYPDPAPLLGTTYRLVIDLPESTEHFNVHFVTPEGGQLYDDLRSSPEEHWQGFQTFLGRVYACLAAAQWTAGKVLLDVEVSFEGEGEVLEGDVIALDGFESLVSSDRPISRTVTCPTLRGSEPMSRTSQPGPSVVALGGTFDHLHAAHKLLLHLALFLTTRKLIVGITADSLLASKAHAPLVESYDRRAGIVHDFLSRHNRRSRPIELDITRISDVYGPTANDPDIDALVVSGETVAGGEAINTLRREKGLGILQVFVIDVIASTLDGMDVPEGLAEDGRGEGEVKTVDLSGEEDEKRLKELKMGSTAIRQWIADRNSDGGTKR